MEKLSLTGELSLDEFLLESLSVMRTKGLDYTEGSHDRLLQFREISKAVGISMEQAWAVFFRKHVSAIMAYIRNGTESEPIEGRITDAVVYLLLFKLIFDERKK